MKTLAGCASLVSVVVAVLWLYGGGRASDPLAVAVANAATRCPDGFTVKVHGLPPGSDPTSSLSDSCVLDLGIPAGATGATGPAGATGAPGPAGIAGTNGVSGYALKTTTVNASKSNSYRLAATAMCPVGKKAVGGGATINQGKGDLFVLTTSRPTSDGQSWTALAINLNSSKSNAFKGINLNPSKSNVKVTVVCAVVS